MSISLGNLSVVEIQERLEIELKADDVERMTKRRQQSAQSEDLEPEQWHCFDMPFQIVCGSRTTQQEWYDILLPYHDEMKGGIQIAVIKRGAEL